MVLNINVPYPVAVRYCMSKCRWTHSCVYPGNNAIEPLAINCTVIVASKMSIIRVAMFIPAEPNRFPKGIAKL